MNIQVLKSLYIQITSNSKHKINKKKQKTEKTKRRKCSFLRDLVENADLYKPVVNKIMTKHEYCLKCNFRAVLTNGLLLNMQIVFYKK